MFSPPENFWMTPVWLVEQAYTNLSKQEKNQTNLGSLAIAQLGADLATFLGAKNIDATRYLPFELEERKVKINPDSAKVLLELLNQGKIPKKFIPAIAKDIDILKKAAKYGSQFR